MMIQGQDASTGRTMVSGHVAYSTCSIKVSEKSLGGCGEIIKKVLSFFYWFIREDWIFKVTCF